MTISVVSYSLQGPGHIHRPTTGRILLGSSVFQYPHDQLACGRQPIPWSGVAALGISVLGSGLLSQLGSQANHAEPAHITCYLHG